MSSSSIFLSFMDLTERRKSFFLNLMKLIKILLKIQIKNLELFSLKWYSIMFSIFTMYVQYIHCKKTKAKQKIVGFLSWNHTYRITLKV